MTLELVLGVIIVFGILGLGLWIKSLYESRVFASYIFKNYPEDQKNYFLKRKFAIIRALRKIGIAADTHWLLKNKLFCFSKNMRTLLGYAVEQGIVFCRQDPSRDTSQEVVWATNTFTIWPEEHREKIITLHTIKVPQNALSIVRGKDKRFMEFCFAHELGHMKVSESRSDTLTQAKKDCPHFDGNNCLYNEICADEEAVLILNELEIKRGLDFPVSIRRVFSRQCPQCPEIRFPTIDATNSPQCLYLKEILNVLDRMVNEYKFYDFS